MAKLRRNHAGRGTAAAGGTIAKLGLFGFIIAALVFGFQQWSGDAGAALPPLTDYLGEDHFAPLGSQGQVIDQGGFLLSYNEDWEQADWVAYVLTGRDLEQEWVDRPRNFVVDPAVHDGSATDDDYRGSGYDRGHLAPFADFAYDEGLALRTFLLSNVSPQARQFNQGVWRELEELTRNWAKKNGRLYVVTGPITSREPKGYIGRNNRIAIPSAYFKVILDLDEPERKAIAFLIDNEISFRPLTEYVVSIDEVEEATGLDFFGELLPDALEEQLEGQSNPDLWAFSRKKFEKRLNAWNRAAG